MLRCVMECVTVNTYFLGLIMEWRGIAFLFCGLSFLTMFMFLFIPESVWWLRKFRPKETEEAEKALAWIYRDTKVYGMNTTDII